MLFGTYGRLPNVDTFSVRVDGQVIQRVYEFKYKGVVSASVRIVRPCFFLDRISLPILGMTGFSTLDS